MENIIANEVVKGYKVFNPDWTCLGFQFEVGKTFSEDCESECCCRGFHFCTELVDCFTYYLFDPINKVAEVEALGDISANDEDSKCATNKIKIVRELGWDEVLRLVNTGKNCTGSRNTGNYNAGSWNTGSYNTGSYNAGNYNAGSWNTGSYNAGNYNAGSWNTGSYNAGNCNTGDCNTGNRNTGNRNTGSWNTGSRNTGSYNAGDCNTGNRNTGSYNAGNRNTGNRNTGNWNTGDYNKSSSSSGCFSNKNNQRIDFFNKPSNWTRTEWDLSEAKFLLEKIDHTHTTWIYEKDMTDEEKTLNPLYKTTGGYLKTVYANECAQKWWDELNIGERNVIKSLPNFDAEVFEDILGIHIN